MDKIWNGIRFKVNNKAKQGVDADFRFKVLGNVRSRVWIKIRGVVNSQK